MQKDKDELFERLQRVEGGAAERDRELIRLRQENLALKHQLEDAAKVCQLDSCSHWSDYQNALPQSCLREFAQFSCICSGLESHCKDGRLLTAASRCTSDQILKTQV